MLAEDSKYRVASMKSRSRNLGLETVSRRWTMDIINVEVFTVATLAFVCTFFIFDVFTMDIFPSGHYYRGRFSIHGHLFFRGRFFRDRFYRLPHIQDYNRHKTNNASTY